MHLPPGSVRAPEESELSIPLIHAPVFFFPTGAYFCLLITVLYCIFSDTDGCGGRRGKTAQGAAGSVGDVGRRACGRSFLLPPMLGYRRSRSLSLHSPLLTFGCVNWSSCCFYYTYLYYFVFLCARRQGEFSSLFATLDPSFCSSFIQHLS